MTNRLSMADEFIKGLAIMMGAGLPWMVLSGWYTNEGFESTQLFGPPPSSPDFWGAVALTLREGLFWFAIIGALTFWVVIPAFREGRRAYESRRSS